MSTPFPRPPDAPEPKPVPDGARAWDASLFGSFRLLGPDGSDATPGGRKARALLAYLLATRDGVTRDRLTGLLWSKRGEDQARASLRQTFYEMRALTTGEWPLIALDRERARIVASQVTTDVERLDASARDDDVAALVAVVGERPAEFLADLDGVDPAFDEWLAIERTRRRDARRHLLLASASRRLTGDDPTSAAQLADRLLACDGADEAAARVAMEASHRRGDRDAVRRIFARLQDVLKQQIGVAPSDETLAVHRRLLAAPASPVSPASSVALVPPVSADLVGATVTTTEPPSTRAGDAGTATVAMPREPIRPRRRWPMLAGIGCTLLLLVAGGAAWTRHGALDPTQRVLLVEPIKIASDDADASALRTGFSAELARVIVGKPAFIVLDADQAADRAPDQTFVVAADAQSHDGVLHVGLRLLARKEGPILWATTLARPVGDVVALREQMAVKVADVAVCALDGRHTDLRAFRPDTLQLLLGACDLRHSESLDAAQLLEQLTRQVPTYSHGWALLAAANAGEGDQVVTDATGAATRTESYARRAIELDPRDGDAYFGRASALQGIARWPQQMAILREGLAMDPDNANLAFALAHHLAQLGYLQQAIAWSERAIHADPFSPVKAAEHAQLLGMAGAGPDATVAFDNARRRFGADPGLMLADFRFQALVGNYRRATLLMADPDHGIRLQPDRAALWAALIATRADPSAARNAEAERAFIASMHAHPEISAWTLEKLAFLDRVDEAYAYADRMPVPSPDEDVWNSLFGVVTRPLRADPRFMTLAARLGLAAIWRATDQWPDFCHEADLGYDCRVEANRALSQDPRPLVARR